MKPFIPEIGTEFILTKKWNFELHAESRNYDFAKQLDIKIKFRNEIDPNDRFASIYWEGGPYEVSLPKDTVLIIDRIYIRRGAKDFSSITLRTKNKLVSKKARFWVKLDAFNKAPMESINE